MAVFSNPQAESLAAAAIRVSGLRRTWLLRDRLTEFGAGSPTNAMECAETARKECENLDCGAVCSQYWCDVCEFLVMGEIDFSCVGKWEQGECIIEPRCTCTPPPQAFEPAG